MPKKLSEDVAERMISRIREGVLQSGDRLPSERALAEEYGVSRTVIREALRSLEMMGCVESRVGEGTYIKAPELSNIVHPFSMVVQNNLKMSSELIELRMILETEVVALAARRRSREHIEALENSIEDMRTEIENGGMGVEADNRFHAVLTEAAGNEAIRTVLSMCSDMLSRTKPITQAVKGVPEITLRDHTDILKAVSSQDERTAKKLMRNHLNHALRNLDRACKTKPGK